MFGVNNVDNATLGSFQLTSTVETTGTAEATNSSNGTLTQAGEATHASASATTFNAALYNCSRLHIQRFFWN